MTSQGHHSHLHYCAIFLLCVCFSSAYAGALDHVAEQWQRDSTYLPYTTEVVSLHPSSNDCGYPISIAARVFKPIRPGQDTGICVKATNVPDFDVGKCRFGAFLYPSLRVPDDDPIDFVITDWRLYPVSEERLPYALGICHTDDSVMAFALDLETDSVRYSTLSRRGPESEAIIKPAGAVLSIDDIDLDGSPEMFLKIDRYDRRARQMYCVDVASLAIKWTIPNSASMGPGNFLVVPDSVNGQAISVSGSPANRYDDTLFNDYYSYITVFDADGTVDWAVIASTYGHPAPTICPADSAGQFFVTYAMWEPALPRPEPESLSYDWRLARIDMDGRILDYCQLPETAHNLWKIAVGPDRDTVLMAVSTPGRWSAYDMDLNLIETSDSAFSMPTFLSYTRIGRYQDPCYVLSDGIYDSRFNKLLEFPIRAATFEPLAIDSSGAVADYLACGQGMMLIGKIERRTKIELASAFYHNNEQYVLMLVSGLVVGLMVVNFFRHRTKRNLATIASQKRQIEHAHQELKDTQEKLMEAEKYRQAKDMAGMFAHEIRNALFPADGLLTKMARPGKGPLPPEKIDQYHYRIRNAVGRAIDMTDTIKTYTSLDARKNVETVALPEIIDDVLESNRQRLNEDEVKVSLQLTDNALVEGNREQFYLVFNNLLVNSLEALKSREHPIVEIYSQTSDDDLRVVWKDNGVGIAESDLPRIFDAFYSTKAGSGTGLGLALLKRIVEMYGGHVSVASTQNEHTTFTVELKKAKEGLA